MRSIEELVVESINLEINEVAYLALNILPILITIRKNGGGFDVGRFLNYLEIKAIKRRATILLPSFSREFAEKKYFNRAATKSRTGFVSNQCLDRTGWLRTAHPIISYVVYGALAKEFAEYPCYSAFGQDSILAKLLKYNPVQYFVGVEPEDAYTYLHYCEQRISAPYRYSKVFNGEYVDYGEKYCHRNYEMYVKRDKNFNFDFRKNIIEIFSLENIENYIIKKIYINENLKNIENLINDQKF